MREYRKSLESFLNITHHHKQYPKDLKEHDLKETTIIIERIMELIKLSKPG